jgi:Predicted permease
MSTAALPSQSGIRCYYRPILLATGLMIIMGVFWFVSRYPQLMHKSTQIGNEMSSMANTGDLIKVAADAPWYAKIGWGAINWLDTMKKGMTFGVLSGALLHTILKYYPLKIGQNLYLNSLKGALVGVPAGVCANCSVPMACGVTRGDGRVEVALGFLFSSPNFNPIVVMMTLSALPLSMFVTKYALLLFVIAVFVPAVVGWLEKAGPLKLLPVDEQAGSCEIPSSAGPCEQSFFATLSELSTEFVKNDRHHAVHECPGRDAAVVPAVGPVALGQPNTADAARDRLPGGADARADRARCAVRRLTPQAWAFTRLCNGLHNRTRGVQPRPQHLPVA